MSVSERVDWAVMSVVLQAGELVSTAVERILSIFWNRDQFYKHLWRLFSPFSQQFSCAWTRAGTKADTPGAESGEFICAFPENPLTP